MDFSNYRSTVEDRFIRYVKIDTQSDPDSDTYPSTEKQKVLGKLLVEELEEMGVADVEMDQYGLVYATIPSNSDKDVPVICFCSHMDTAPDVSGKDVRPIIHRNYDGSVITLPDDPAVKLSPEEHPNLRAKKGEDIVTASGTTLLGADNKAGIAAIMDAAHFLLTHPEVKHGDIRLLFTCDEEIGKGTVKVDMEKLNADFGYTVDGEEAGTLENETFSADMATVLFKGIPAHPGFAKNKMVSALKVAADFVDSLPGEQLSPETTEDRQPFIHPMDIKGGIEQATVVFILRSFDTTDLPGQADLLRDLARKACDQWPGAKFEIKVEEQYRNMKEVLDQHPQVVEYAKEAIRRSGFDPMLRSIRGGTDGSRLSHMGLPCPNIYAGEHSFHSKTEWASLQDIEKSARTIVHLAALYEENA